MRISLLTRVPTKVLATPSSKPFIFRKPVLINRYSIFVRDIEPKGFRLLTMDGFVTPSIARRVDQILRNPELRQEIVDHNYEVARQFYSYSVVRGILQRLHRQFDRLLISPK